MQVNLQYAEEHLSDLADAVDSGQDVEISRVDKPSLRLIRSNGADAATIDRTGMIGSGKGGIWYADDWDSPEVNEAIARDFNESRLFPNDPEA
jgi:antitoxin (DNA-binding transcriptional repressor) of toxin-antitoxin stability system